MKNSAMSSTDLNYTYIRYQPLHNRMER